MVEIPRAALAADPARHHPAHAAGALGAQVREHLDAGRLAAQGLDREAGACCSAATSASAATGRSSATRCATASRRSPACSTTCKAAGADRVLVLPLYPQYAAATTASIGDARRGLDAARPQPARDALRQALPRRPRLHRRAAPGASSEHWMTHGRPDKLVLSFHGLPRRSLTLGDPYHCECLKTGAPARRAAEAARRLRRRHVPEPLRQGRVAAALHRADAGRAGQGRRRAGSTCSAPASRPIASRRSRRSTRRRGPRSWPPAATEFGYIPCLNDQHEWIAALADDRDRGTSAAGRPRRRCRRAQASSTTRSGAPWPPARRADARPSRRPRPSAGAASSSCGSSSTATITTQQADRPGPLQEDRPAALADRERVAHLRLGERAEDHADDDRRGREVEAPHDARRAGRCRRAARGRTPTGACRRRRPSRRSGCRRRAAASGSSAA